MDPIEKSLGFTHWECAPECVLNVPLSVTVGSWLLHCLFLVGLGWKQFCSGLFSHHEGRPLHVPKNQWVHPATDHKLWNYSPLSLRKIILSGILLWWQKADDAVIVSHLQWIQPWSRCSVICVGSLRSLCNPLQWLSPIFDLWNHAGDGIAHISPRHLCQNQTLGRPK